MSVHYADATVTLHHGDCLDVLRSLPDSSVDSVCDPPYGLEFMGKDWDKFDKPTKGRADLTDHTNFTPKKSKFKNGVGTQVGMPKKNPRCRICSRLKFDKPASKCSCQSPDWDTRTRENAQMFGDWCEAWSRECLRVLKPGGHLLAFGGTRTWHRLACAVEDAGFEVRDSIAWLYGSGFPKSHNVRKALGDNVCRCHEVESEHGEPATEHGVRDLSGADVPAPGRAGGGTGKVLLPRLSEPGTPDARRSELPTAQDGRGEPGVEGRRDDQAAEGQLRRPALRPLPAGVPADGTEGRLRHGAPAGHGATDRPDADSHGVCGPRQPRPEGQPTGEPGALPDERGSQEGRGWPLCAGCGKPAVTDGLGTALKPAFEPVVVARKPLVGTVAKNVLEHDTGALNIDGCRIGGGGNLQRPERRGKGSAGGWADYTQEPGAYGTPDGMGRWPANVILDESQADALDEQSGTSQSRAGKPRGADSGDGWGMTATGAEYDDLGGASRFFPVMHDEGYCCPDCEWEAQQPDIPLDALAERFRYEAKAPASERPKVNGTAHPTVKPLALMRWLVRLVTPPGGTVLEPFAGSGTTVEACIVEGFHCIAIEREADYLPLIEARIARRRDPVKAITLAGDDLGLFGEATA